MKNPLFLIVLFAFTCSVHAQAVRGLRIGYIDMEYILENVPDYAEAKNQLEQKAQRWKQEINAKNTEIDKLKESLKTERVLLTKELIEEREEEISFQEKELMDFQETRFGPNGALIVQKAVLIKPIQDQVFTAVQDIAVQRKYDFVFDKSSDLTMMFAAQQFDISDMVVRQLTRASKRSELSKSELKQQEKQELQEDDEDPSSDVAIRKKLLEEKNAVRDSLNEARKIARDQLISDKKAAADAKREAAIAKRQAIIDARNGVTPAKNIEKDSSTEEKPATQKENVTDPEKEKDSKKDGTPATENILSTEKEKDPKKEVAPETAKTTDKEAARKAAIDAKKKEIEDRKKALADKKAKMIKEREDAKKAQSSPTPSKE